MQAEIAMEMAMGSDVDSDSDESSDEGEDDPVADLVEGYVLAQSSRYLTRPGICRRQTINNIETSQSYSERDKLVQTLETKNIDRAQDLTRRLD